MDFPLITTCKRFDGNEMFAPVYNVLPNVDLTPDLSEADIVRRLDRRPAKESLSNRLRKALGLSPVARALLGKEVGEEVTIDLPDGRLEVEITTIKYC